ncbi:MAG: hypothetical protein K1X79_12070 [Oligoflexia bacterium]|nr:hypothetical protein [Oligoflexia bacterium]
MSNLHAQRGLTLIELTFAVLILAGSVVVLLGLQTSALKLAAHDHNSQRAMLAARRLLAPMETTRKQLENRSYEGTFPEVLKEVAPYDTDLIDPRDERLSVSLQIGDWGIPDVNPQAMKQVTLDIRWGEAVDDQLGLFYFIPAEEGKDQEQEEP